MNWTNLPSKEVVQNVMMASPNGVLVLQAIRSADGGIIDLYMTQINRIAERELDCPAVEVLGQSLSIFFPHLAQKSLLERYRQVLDTGKVSQFETHFFRPGASKPTWLDVTVVRIEKSLLITYSDTTEAKIDGKPELLVDVLKLAFEESSNGISVFEALHDEQGRVNDFKLVMINKAGLVMSGFLHDGIIGRTIWEMYPSTNINGLFRQYVQVYETGERVSLEHYYPEYAIWRDVKIMPVDRGIMVTYADTTALRKAESASKQQDELLTAVFESLPIGMAVLAPIRIEKEVGCPVVDFRLTKTNAALEHIFDQPDGYLAGRLLSQLVKPVDALSLLDRCITSSTEGEAQTFDMSLGSRQHTNWYRVSITVSNDQLVLSFTPVVATE